MDLNTLRKMGFVTDSGKVLFCIFTSQTNSNLSIERIQSGIDGIKTILSVTHKSCNGSSTVVMVQ